MTFWSKNQFPQAFGRMMQKRIFSKEGLDVSWPVNATRGSYREYLMTRFTSLSSRALPSSSLRAASQPKTCARWRGHDP